MAYVPALKETPEWTPAEFTKPQPGIVRAINYIKGDEMLSKTTQKELLAIAKTLLKHEALEMCARLDSPQFADQKCKRAMRIIKKAEKQINE